MKKVILFSVLAFSMPLLAQAQDDDLYFTPKKEVVKVVKPQNTDRQAPDYYSGSKRDIDEYNRYGHFSSRADAIDSTNDVIDFGSYQGIKPDTVYVDSSFVEKYLSDNEDYRYTRGFSRWDGFYDPWFYDYYGWGPYYWRSRYWGWDPWYYSYGYFDPWYDPWYFGYTGWWNAWYDPWYYGYGWGPYYGRYYSWDPYWGGGFIARTTHNPIGNGVGGGHFHPIGSSKGNTYASRGTYTNRNGNTYTSRSRSNRSFGSRVYTPNNNANSRTNNGFGTRSYGSNSNNSGSYHSSGNYGGASHSGGFGGGSNGGFSRGGGGGGGGHFGGHR